MLAGDRHDLLPAGLIHRRGQRCVQGRKAIERPRRSCRTCRIQRSRHQPALVHCHRDNLEVEMLCDGLHRRVCERLGEQHIAGTQHCKHGNHESVLRTACENNVTGVHLKTDALQPACRSHGVAVLITLELIVEKGCKPV